MIFNSIMVLVLPLICIFKNFYDMFNSRTVRRFWVKCVSFVWPVDFNTQENWWVLVVVLTENNFPWLDSVHAKVDASSIFDSLDKIAFNTFWLTLLIVFVVFVFFAPRTPLAYRAFFSPNTLLTSRATNKAFFFTRSGSNQFALVQPISVCMTIMTYEQYFHTL
jgi:hypothetical protein